MPKLPKSFYLRDDVVQISQELLGKILCTNFDGVFTSGIIVETEAYRGVEDRASHAWNNRRTARTKIMFARGGVAYVYLCYGIHHLFNVVTNVADIPHAVLIRAVEPVAGLDKMLERRKYEKMKPTLTSGPGSASAALGIRVKHSGLKLDSSKMWIEDNDVSLGEEQIICSPRVGISYAGEHADWPWRFRVKGNRWTSPAK